MVICTLATWWRFQDRLEQHVGEAEHQQVEHLLLAEEVVDAEHALLGNVVEHQPLSSRAEARSRPNGFSITTRPSSVSPTSARRRDDVSNRLGGTARYSSGRSRRPERVGEPTVGLRVVVVARARTRAARARSERVVDRGVRPWASMPRRACSRSRSTSQSERATPTTRTSSPRRPVGRARTARGTASWARSPVAPNSTTASPRSAPGSLTRRPGSPRGRRTVARSVATTFIAAESSWREANRANSAAAIAGAGTASSIASWTVHRPSPESSA
jgi:hypothetical protein